MIRKLVPCFSGLNLSMSRKRKRKENDASDSQPFAKRVKQHKMIFTNDFDQQYFIQTYEAITSSNMHISHDIVQTLSEFASGHFVKCDNYKHCNNKILPSKGDVKIMEQGIDAFDWNQIYEDCCDKNGPFQTDILNAEAKKYVETYGYFWINWNGDKEKYFCADCINEKGGYGLDECSVCFEDKWQLCIWNEREECACGHYALYCDECNIHESRYCKICQETKCHIDDIMNRQRTKYDDKFNVINGECHQQFECCECESIWCSGAKKSVTDLKWKCECYDTICIECKIQVKCDGCGDLKCVTHESCWYYEWKIKEKYTKCDNVKCQYNNWKNGPLYKLWFGKKS
eukprot:455009_1